MMLEGLAAAVGIRDFALDEERIGRKTRRLSLTSQVSPASRQALGSGPETEQHPPHHQELHRIEQQQLHPAAEGQASARSHARDQASAVPTAWQQFEQPCHVDVGIPHVDQQRPAGLEQTDRPPGA